MLIFENARLGKRYSHEHLFCLNKIHSKYCYLINNYLVNYLEGWKVVVILDYMNINHPILLSYNLHPLPGFQYVVSYREVNESFNLKNFKNLKSKILGSFHHLKILYG